MAQRALITCDQCGEPIPTLSEWLAVRPTYGPQDDMPDLLRLDFCSAACRVQWGEEHAE